MAISGTTVFIVIRIFYWTLLTNFITLVSIDEIIANVKGTKYPTEPFNITLITNALNIWMESAPKYYFNKSRPKQEKPTFKKP